MIRTVHRFGVKSNIEHAELATRAEIARRLNVAPLTVLRITRAAGIDPVATLVTGSRGPSLLWPLSEIEQLAAALAIETAPEVRA